MRRQYGRSAEAQAYRRLYNCRAWRDRRLSQLREEPLCRYCRAIDIVEPATVADHIVPHRGDEALFWTGELQSLCAPCHSRIKQIEERGGWTGLSDERGYPLDPNHPSRR